MHGNKMNNIRNILYYIILIDDIHNFKTNHPKNFNNCTVFISHLATGMLYPLAVSNIRKTRVFKVHSNTKHSHCDNLNVTF